MAQEIISPRDLGQWVGHDFVMPDNSEARKRRDIRFKELKAKGHNPRKFSLPNQLISVGGIGSGMPHNEYVVNAYGIDY